MKKFLTIVWRYAYPLRQIYEWGLELFYVRVHNGKTTYEKSSTKAIRTLVGFVVIGGLYIVALAFYVKLGGNPGFLKMTAKQVTVIRVGLTAGVLGIFVSFLTALGTWYGFLQHNYTKHKQKVIEHVKNGGPP